MKTNWLSHIKDQTDKDNFKSYLLSVNTIWDRFHFLLSSMSKEHKDSDYKEAGWPYYRAYTDGYNQALKDIKELTNFKIKED